MAERAKTIHHATYDDLRALPENVIGEIIDGELVVSPRPGAPHAVAGSAIGSDVNGQFGGRSGGGRPGGWWILYEPELHLTGHVLVPDWAGWRRERMPSPGNVAAFTTVPDWACEIVSPSSVQRDRLQKMHIYASLGVASFWLVDPIARVVESYRLAEGRWVVEGTWGGAESARIPPFDAVEVDLEWWWLPEDDEADEPGGAG